MNTPIYSFAENYIKAGMVRAHMPGHKGRSDGSALSEAYPYDLTEIKGADALFEADGIIAESEKNASELFGCPTFYSCGGSTHCIQVMLAAVCPEGSTVVAARNSHKAFINTCALLDLRPEWVYPRFDGSAVSGEITAESVERAVQKAEKPACVFITSPDYLGKMADIKEIAQVCGKYSLPLLVDGAHGAYLRFLDTPSDAMSLGADLCCTSAHKTLPVLTGGAYLHAKPRFVPAVKRMRSVFASSSPSYLIMESLDLCNAYIDGGFRDELNTAISRLNGVKSELDGFIGICPSEPLKMAVYAPKSGMTGCEMADKLRLSGIEPEYADMTHVLLMFSSKSTAEDFSRVKKAFQTMPQPRLRIEPPSFALPRPKVAMTPRKALFAPCETVSVDKAWGKICARSETVCPPCVPVAACGEVYDAECIKILKMYSISEVNVVQ